MIRIIIQETEKKKGDLFNMTLENIIRKIGKRIDKVKRITEPWLDKTLLFGALNTAIIYKAMEAIDKSNLSDPTNNMIMIGTGAALGAADYYLFISPKTRKIRQFISRINKKVDKKRVLSWIKTGILIGALGWGARGVTPYAKQIKADISSHLKPNKQVVSIEEKTQRIRPEKIIRAARNRPLFYDKLGYERKVNHDFTGTKLAPKDSDIGRIQRTLRWQPIYNTIEKAYALKKDTLAGMIIQESYGDPVQPNAKGDGGLGLVHIQGTTAQNYGLRIYGSSKKASDFKHGKQIKQMLRKCNYDPTCIQKYDERVHFIKNLDTGARIVREGINKYGSWEYGIEYYRAPGMIGRNKTWLYMHRVSEWIKKIQDKELISLAAIDFEQRNNYSFKEYIRKWHEMNTNWGLDVYIKNMPGVSKPAKSLADEIPDTITARQILTTHTGIIRNRKKSIPEWVTYRVKKGDTLYHIVHRIAKGRISIEQLKKQNKIYNNNIKPNQVLKLYKKQ